MAEVATTRFGAATAPSFKSSGAFTHASPTHERSDAGKTWVPPPRALRRAGRRHAPLFPSVACGTCRLASTGRVPEMRRLLALARSPAARRWLLATYARLQGPSTGPPRQSHRDPQQRAVARLPVLAPRFVGCVRATARPPGVGRFNSRTVNSCSSLRRAQLPAARPQQAAELRARDQGRAPCQSRFWPMQSCRALVFRGFRGLVRFLSARRPAAPRLADGGCASRPPAQGPGRSSEPCAGMSPVPEPFPGRQVDSRAGATSGTRHGQTTSEAIPRATIPTSAPRHSRLHPRCAPRHRGHGTHRAQRCSAGTWGGGAGNGPHRRSPTKRTNESPQCVAIKLGRG
jgi:hypothetical protein